jgi:hypothetical protein
VLPPTVPPRRQKLAHACRHGQVDRSDLVGKPFATTGTIATRGRGLRARVSKSFETIKAPTDHRMAPE